MLALVLAVAACGGTTGSSDQESASTTAAAAPPTTTPAPCPVDPIPVVVSVDQWGDIVEQLGGSCVEVTTIIKGSAGDPHDYEPTAADISAFGDARLVVVNGVDYDHWATDAADALSPRPAIVDAGEVVGATDDANPHLWYGPDDVVAVSSAITTELGSLEPTAMPYFAARAADWTDELAPYLAEVAALRASAQARPFGATESVFDPMADALGLENVTPEGFRRASANESDPAPGDIAAFQTALRDGSMAVLVVNTQTAGSVPEQLREVADDAGVPVIEVTETLPPGVDSFVAWQLAQLQALRDALS